MQEAEHPLVHAGAPRSRDDQDRLARSGASLDRPGDLFPYDRTHAPAEELKIHDRKGNGFLMDSSRSADDRIAKAGLLLIMSESVLVALGAMKMKGVDRREGGVGLSEAVGIDQESNPFASGKRKVVLAVLADPLTLSEFLGVEHMLTDRTFHPKPSGNVSLWAGGDAGCWMAIVALVHERGWVQLGSRDRQNAHRPSPQLPEPGRTLPRCCSGRDYVVH